MELHEAVVCLANWRAEAKRLQAAQQELLRAVMESTEWKRLGEEFVHAHEMEGETEATVRELAVDFYNTTGDKRAHEVVTVKVYDVLEYDPTVALNYCREHLPNALKLDARAFEKAAKAIPLAFVEIVETPKATIASDLSAYL